MSPRRLAEAPATSLAVNARPKQMGMHRYRRTQSQTPTADQGVSFIAFSHRAY